MRKFILGALLLLALPLIALAADSSAQTFRSGTLSTVATDEIIDGMSFLTGTTVEVSGTVDGDVYCMGQNITINGTVNGDVLCMGQTITISGKVSGNVRIAAQTAIISGDVEGSASVAAQTVTVDSSGRIGFDAALLGQSINVDGPVTRDVALSAAGAFINTTVGRNVTANVETLTLGSQAMIDGTLTYTSPNALTKDTGATVKGKTTYNESVSDQTSPQIAHIGIGLGIGISILWAIMLIVSAILFSLVFPRELYRTTNESLSAVSKALLTVVVGLVAAIVVPAIIFFLVVTVFGFPFALVLLLTWLLILAISGAFSAFYIGRLVFRSRGNAVLVMLVGSVILIVLLMIPLLGLLVGLLSVWYGSGAILLELKRHLSAPRYDLQDLAKNSQK